jgi:hypothetical protein
MGYALAAEASGEPAVYLSIAVILFIFLLSVR